MSDERRVIEDAALVLPSQSQIAASVLLPIAVGALFTLVGGPMKYFFVAAAAIAAVAYARRAMHAPRVDAGYGRLVVSSAGCRLGDFAIDRSEIRRARIVRARGLRAMVLLERGWFRSSFGLRMDYPDAHAVVQALELDVGRVRDRFTTNGPGTANAQRLARWGGIFAFVAFFAMLWIRPFHLPAPWWVPIFLFSQVSRLAGRGDIGPDGITVRWLLWTWHVALADIVELQRAHQNGFNYRVIRRRGAPLVVSFRKSEEAEASAFEARVNELLAERDGASPILIETFERLASNGPVKLAAETFRDVGLTMADLQRIVSDGRVRAATRARAAVALDDKGALLRVAEQTTHPQLRVALQKAARDEEIDEDLIALEAER